MFIQQLKPWLQAWFNSKDSSEKKILATRER